MVLPFGLASDGHNVAGNQNMVTPTAPPAFLMHGHTNVSTVVPIIPSPYIDFIVVNGDDRCRIRCERKAVLVNSVGLAKRIRAGPNSGRKGDNHFQISNVDKNDFELVIRFLETKFVRYRDHLHILKILELADRFNCPDLVSNCKHSHSIGFHINFFYFWFIIQWQNWSKICKTKLGCIEINSYTT